MSEFGIIGGTGLGALVGLESVERHPLTTPYGAPSAPAQCGRLHGHELLFLPRHGDAHSLPPHQVNYRANVWALHSLGVRRLLAINAVGGIRADLDPGMLAIPDQVIDYTHSREHSYCDPGRTAVQHIDFTQPFDEPLRRALIEAAHRAGLHVSEWGTYGATQGPRLETAAEIDRLERDGCHMVGMTAMPEAALARELELEYACCALVTNRAAGRGGVSIHAEIETAIASSVTQVERLLAALVPALFGT